MAIIFHGPVRLVLRRSAPRHQQLFSPTKRQKSTSAEKQPGKSSPVLKREGSSIATPAELSTRPLWERFGPLSEVWAGYSRAQKKRPWTTQLCTSLVVYLCGDLAAQYIDGEKYNPFRTLRHLTIGGIFAIPAYSWYLLVFSPTSNNVNSKLRKADRCYTGSCT